MKNPTVDEFRKVVDSWQPNILYLQGEQFANNEVGSLVWGGVDLNTAEAITGLFGSMLPTTVGGISFILWCFWPFLVYHLAFFWQLSSEFDMFIFIFVLDCYKLYASLFFCIIGFDA